MIDKRFKIEKLTDLPYYTEGPVIDNKGNVFCTTLRGGSILNIDDSGKQHEWAHSTCPNGQAVSKNGDHLICDSMTSAIRRFSKHGEWIKDEVKNQCAGKPVYVPNDLIVDRKGGIYFTDSKRHTGSVFYVGENGNELVIASHLDYPNGLVLSHDEQFLFVAESYGNRIIKIDVTLPVSTENRITLFANLPSHASGREQDNLPDGLALDQNSNLWVAHYGMQAVQVLSAQGNLIVSIDTTMPYTSNLAFIDDDTVLVTGGYGEPGPGALFLIDIK